MDQDLAASGGWRFAQCFGDKGDVDDITEGQSMRSFATSGRPEAVHELTTALLNDWTRYS